MISSVFWTTDNLFLLSALLSLNSQGFRNLKSEKEHVTLFSRTNTAFVDNIPQEIINIHGQQVSGYEKRRAICNPCPTVIVKVVIQM